ncbi:MAG: hypothetical protein N4S04_06875 [Lactobacillus crispatus]|nr:hypothetical protein [Lactobacillus crispatus]
MKKAKFKLDKTFIIGLLAIVVVLVIGTVYIVKTNDISSENSKTLQTTKVSNNTKKVAPSAKDNVKNQHLIINVDDNVENVTINNVNTLVNKNNTDLKKLNCYQFGVCVVSFVSKSIHNPNYLALWNNALKDKQFNINLVSSSNGISAFMNKGTVYKVKVDDREVYYSIDKNKNVHFYDGSNMSSLIEIGSAKLGQIIFVVNRPQNQSEVKHVIKYVNVNSTN